MQIKHGKQFEKLKSTDVKLIISIITAISERVIIKFSRGKPRF